MPNLFHWSSCRHPQLSCVARPRIRYCLFIEMALFGTPWHGLPEAHSSQESQFKQRVMGNSAKGQVHPRPREAKKGSRQTAKRRPP